MLELRPANEADFDFLWDVHVQTMKDYISRTWGWNEDAQKKRFRERFDPSLLQVIRMKGKDVGVLAVEPEAERVVLTNIAIMPDYQRKGIGSRAISRILEDASQMKLPVDLQVLKVNPARALYERLGFRLIEETDTHYVMEQLSR